MSIQIIQGDCMDVLLTLDGASIDACLTDPPYHLTSMVKRLSSTNQADIEKNFSKTVPGQARSPYAQMAGGFMGKKWDGGDIAFRPELWANVFRVLKPGAFLLAFGGTRTYHRLACAIEEAGFEIRDQFAWCYGSGFPKSQNASKAIDRELGGKREIVGVTTHPDGRPRSVVQRDTGIHDGGHTLNGVGLPITAPATPAAAAWEGFGTAVKPAWEPLCLARKPMIGNLAKNLLAHGTGALNIDGCRIGTSGGGQNGTNGDCDRTQYRHGAVPRCEEPIGRWPANLAHDGSDEVMEAFAAAGERSSGAWRENMPQQPTAGVAKNPERERLRSARNRDTGSAARFFYTAKADRADRADSKHPTVKPIDLLRHYLRLITPPGGTIIDPFGGSGTTAEAAMLEGFNPILIERDPQSVADIQHRIRRWSGLDAPLFADVS